MIGRFAKPKRSTGPAAGFTLIEWLVVIMVIAILAGIVLGAIGMAQDAARKAKTKALIAKLHLVIMERYESYDTRRVPIDTSELPPKVAAELRLQALRMLMKYEMPDRWNDVPDNPDSLGTIQVKAGSITREMPYPALSYVYAAYKQSRQMNPQGEGEGFGQAECLYMIVAVGHPEAMENFRLNEIGNADEGTGDEFPEFLDGWGRPIMFLRWAPGFSSELGGPSQIQSGNPMQDHDPSDPLRLDPTAFHLIPLIYSGGADQKYDINGGKGTLNGPYNLQIGRPVDNPDNPDGQLNHGDNVHNHAIEAR